ncbi:hypothetical protein [Pseudoroseicyclus aestuarii]|uniref:Transferrin-binding protein B C-lobe/N-lobe beta barrel domain-containing protein n=1 Tax=Pseudoroseicyclus aestuarii TaxID=1795041 RepID=A0A318SRD5_9RHOB|nr:hypothetical protein [Pseudoroseicyclus aestuarii]PYE84162.1 hypothetical protein DFP88_103529 [Pseudoroseicyclus aestuarii]
MTAKYFSPIATSMLLALSACNSGGGSDTDGPLAPRVFDTRLESFLEDEALVDTAEGISGADLPVSGSARYDGSILLTQDELSPEFRPGALIGRASMTADFAASRIGGRADSFVDEADRAYDGSLTIAPTDIDRQRHPEDDFSFEGPIAGTLTHGTTRLEIEGTHRGGFATAEDGTETAISIVDGTMTSGGNTASMGGVILTKD